MSSPTPSPDALGATPGQVLGEVPAAEPEDLTPPLGPVPPFAVTVADVEALLPHANLIDGPAGAAGTGPLHQGVTRAQVHLWLTELSGRVSRRLDGWHRLPGAAATFTEVAEDGTVRSVLLPGDRQQLLAAARAVVADGAASYTEAALHPYRGGTDAGAYADVLWSRFTDGLGELGEWLSNREPTGIDAGDEAGVGEVYEGAPLVRAPAPAFTRGMGF